MHDLTPAAGPGQQTLLSLAPLPAGFPACGACAYRRTGTPALCFACVSAPAASPPGAACRLCRQALVDGACPNTVCRLDDPWFARIHTVTERADDLWTAMTAYKYDEDRGWADVLGRVLVGYLDAQRDEMARYDLITTGALYVGPQARRLWDHLRLVLDAARAHGPQWPFAEDLITKSVPTGQFLGRSPQVRAQIAEGELRAALAVPDPLRVAGKRVLVVDDVYSEGYSLREMARVLVLAGASEVGGLVFARRKGG